MYILRYTRRDKPDEKFPVSQSITFQVANFERLRFESHISIPDIALFAGDEIKGNLEASYLAGGGLSGAPYTYYWTREPSYAVPGGEDGVWRNWRFGPIISGGRYFLGQGEGALGPQGQAELEQTASADNTVEGGVYRYRVEASVQDPARQEISSRANVTVHPASFYIASRLDKGEKNKPDMNASSPSAWFLEARAGATLSWALVDAVSGSLKEPGSLPDIEIEFIRYEWKQSKQQGTGGRINLSWERVENSFRKETIRPEKEAAGVVKFTPDAAGQWEVRLKAADEKGRSAVTAYSFYVSGGGWVRWGGADADAITLTPDRTSYVPGETAALLVQSPLPKGKYLLTVEREGIISEKIIELDGSARTIPVPIEESYVPVVYVAIASYTVRSGPPENSYYEPDLGKPKGLFGLTALHVDTESRSYKIEIENDKGVYSPGGEANVTLKVTQGGKPAPGVELTFMAVDRGVIDLIDYHVRDPLEFFYDPARFPLGVAGADSRSLLIDPVTYSLADLQGGDDEDSSKIEERKDFRPTAVFEPFIVTGDDGTAVVKFTLTDSLTTYRCTAVAAGVEDFGLAEDELKVSSPLTAQVVLPRGLRWRDTGTASLLLTNLDASAVKAEVALEITGAAGDAALVVDGDASQTLTIAPGESVEAPFRVAATGSGEAELAFTLRSPEVNERIVKTLTVSRPMLYETVTTTGSLDAENPFIEEGVVLPALIPPGTGSLSVAMAASRLASLKEAVNYLFDYPYGCLEQQTARLLPIVAFGNHLAAYGLESAVSEPEKLVEETLRTVARSQLPDGGFPYWPGGSYASFYVSLRVAHIVSLAEGKGYEIPAALDRAKLVGYIARTMRLDHAADDPFMYGYALWVRAMAGERVGSEISAFLKRGDELGISGWALAGLAAGESGQADLALSARDRVRRFIRPGTRTLDLTDTYERVSFWGGETARYALALMLYNETSPGDDMTTRLAATLVERQRRGVWSNTDSSFWAVLAFGAVGDREAEEAADFKADASLGGVNVASAEFRSYGGTPFDKALPLDEPPIDALERGMLLPLRIERGEGAGRLYYTASLRYGIPAELASARDEGIGVYAETLDLDGNAVKGELLAGKTYVRRVVVSSARDRTFLSLRAPVPSGCEIIDASFVTSATMPPAAAEEDDGKDGLPRYWEEAPVMFIMNDEARYSWDLFTAGKREAEFRFRAVMPGVYPTPPPQAECMYEGEVFGRGNGELIIIK
jgi:uncharacterized protein YfaS (alpha-2-macroglobulin family)